AIGGGIIKEPELGRQSYLKALTEAGGSRTMTIDFMFNGPEARYARKSHSLVFKGEALAYSDMFYSRVAGDMDRIRGQFEKDWHEHGLGHASARALGRYKRVLNRVARLRQTMEGAGKVLPKVEGLDDFIKGFGDFVDHVDAVRHSNTTRIHTQSPPPSNRRTRTYFPSYRIQSGKRTLSSGFGQKLHSLEFVTLHENPVQYLAPLLHATDAKEYEHLKEGYQDYFPGSRNSMRVVIVSGNTHGNPVGGAVDFVRASQGFDGDNPLVTAVDVSGTIFVEYSKEGKVVNVKFEHSGGSASKVFLRGKDAASFMTRFTSRMKEAVDSARARAKDSMMPVYSE